MANYNGITGYVASSRESYICNDTKNDALYLQGAIDAKSSLTTPLIFNDKVIGVCNAESCESNAFSPQDQVFLELYAQDLAYAIDTFENNKTREKEIRKACNQSLKEGINPAIVSAFSSIVKDCDFILCNNKERTKSTGIYQPGRSYFTNSSTDFDIVPFMG